ncbi:MAG TPA: N-acetylmuramoyl-L-alanine amidase, partial [Sphaerochaeta sp.]|nr:N-acetylmuramoyl-L-alanine amidase [Sphaerochaeta sp.]
MAKIVRTIILLMCLIAAPLFSVDNPFALPLGTIVIDAGHGGHDPGAIRSFEGSLIVERELTL